jgi:hypothetical protein
MFLHMGFSLLSAGEGDALRSQSAAQGLQGIRPDAVQLCDLGLAETGQLFEAGDAGPGQRPPCRCSQFGEIGTRYGIFSG